MNIDNRIKAAFIISLLFHSFAILASPALGVILPRKTPLSFEVTYKRLNDYVQVRRVEKTQRLPVPSRLSQIDGCTVNGHPAECLCTTVNVHVDGVDAQTLVMCLDLDGIAVSTGAACSSGRIEPSHVLLAMGHTAESAKSCVRISLGRLTTEAEVDAVLTALQRHVPRLRAIARHCEERSDEAIQIASPSLRSGSQ